LRTIKPGKGSKSRRMNRKRANHLRGKIREQAKDKAYLHQVVTVEVNAHGTSQYCCKCGAKGERCSYQNSHRITVKWGKLFVCPVCHYEAHADFNASVNVHHSFYREWHWHPRTAKAPAPSPVENGT
jgi:putative transposase